MANSFLAPRSLRIKRFLNHGVFRRSFVSMVRRVDIALENTATLQEKSVRKVSLKKQPTRTPFTRLYSTEAGIVHSKYTIDIPEKSVTEFVTSKFREYGDDIAVIDGSSERTYTYNELSALIEKLGSALTKRGFKKGDVLAVFLPNVPEYPILFFGVIALGGVVTTLNPTLTEMESAYQLKDAGAKYIVTVPPIADKAKKAALEVGIRDVFVIGEAEGCEPLATLLNDDGSAFPSKVPVSPKEDVCVMPYSSGTTGFPKGVMITHHILVAQTCMLSHEAYRSHPLRGTALGLLPFFHIFGMVAIMAQYLMRGGKIICMQQFDGKEMLRLIQDYKIHCICIVPPIVTFLTKSPLVANYDLTSLDTIVSGAAPLGKELTVALKDRFPFVANIGQGYGMTEAGATISPRNEWKPGSSGTVLPNLQAKVVDVQTGEPLGPNQSGEVCIKGPGVMKGYLNNQKATAESITPDGWFHSGDIGYYDKDGHFYIVDRIKDLIKFKGFPVAPAELEALLHTHPKVMDVAVIGIPHESAGEVPKAFVVPKGEVTETEIIEFVAERVAPHKKLTGGVAFVEQITKTASGKILKRELRNL
ncbi:uncharacterized protein [Montipora foliosa]|uniref:uncharacterized protein n=1 Tax=Montipora foliosa TaxID=591990 RepID=UPI0035F11E70